jgi:L-fuculose-phosphate aldolase
VVGAVRALVADRLVVGTAGNVSVRTGDGAVAVTPSAVDYGALTPGLVGVHAADGTALDAPLRPTSELGLHLAVYARTSARAVVHTHSPAATALSVLVPEVPPVHYYLALFGGRVPVVPYAPYGGPELAAAAAGALAGGSACLLGNHGAVVTGASLDQAVERAGYLEWVCDVALRVLSAVPGQARAPRLLTPAEMAEAVERISGYRPGPPQADG